ncbi:MAG: hypothetical protein IPK48_00400 [Gammaproteobacteria bacterium]|nr:hypothetical protein [Gammaproteobacteria bacterium]
MAEVIGLVAELDSERLLKTDLLGDAIESAAFGNGWYQGHWPAPHTRPYPAIHGRSGYADFQSRLFDPAVGHGRLHVRQL